MTRKKLCVGADERVCERRGRDFSFPVCGSTVRFAELSAKRSGKAEPTFTDVPESGVRNQAAPLPHLRMMVSFNATVPTTTVYLPTFPLENTSKRAISGDLQSLDGSEVQFPVVKLEDIAQLANT